MSSTTQHDKAHALRIFGCGPLEQLPIVCPSQRHDGYIRVITFIASKRIQGKLSTKGIQLLLCECDWRQPLGGAAKRCLRLTNKSEAHQTPKGQASQAIQTTRSSPNRRPSSNSKHSHLHGSNPNQNAVELLRIDQKLTTGYVRLSLANLTA